MVLETIEVTSQVWDDFPFPKMISVEQCFPRQKVADVRNTVALELEKVAGQNWKGKHIAVTAGSRGIAEIVDILRAIVEKLQAWGALPFIVPAMGSHGGATAAGQRALLEGYGINEAVLGVPIRSSMEVVAVAQLEDGTPLYCDKLAAEADGIVLCNKIKPHSDFKADYESGLVKMLAIGLGKHKGAIALHNCGFDRFHRILPEAGRQLLSKLPVRFGLAILENAYEEPMRVEALLPAEIMSREKELLEETRKSMGRLLLPEIDVLVVDEIGKNISGTGMDPNVTGRPGTRLPGFSAPPIQKIVILDITAVSHGNGVGIGMADITTLDCVNKIDFNGMYTNAITAANLDPAKIPVVMNNDREALALAIRTCSRVSAETAKVVRIKNTLELSRIEVSEACLPAILQRADISVLGEPFPIRFDAMGRLERSHPTQEGSADK